MPFVHLHVHSHFSVLDGTASPELLVQRAADLSMSAIALTDTVSLYGAVAFQKACKDAGIRPIIGAEIHVQPQGLGHTDPLKEEGGYQLVVLVENACGYRHLCHLLTRSIFDGMCFKPRVDLALLKAHSEGLIFLTGGLKGMVGRQFARGGATLVEASFQELSSFLSKDQLFIELVDHGVPHRESHLEVARALARSTGYRTVVTNAVHYLEREDAPTHEALNCIANGTSLKDEQRVQSPTDQAWFKSSEEMALIFPEDGDALALTADIAGRCRFEFQLGQHHFPATRPPDMLDSEDGPKEDEESDDNWAYFYETFPPPVVYGLDDQEGVPPRPPAGGSLFGYFRWYASRGLAVRLEHIEEGRHDEYRERLDYELEVIRDMGFPAYLLIVAEFINWSKDNGIPVGPGRGSAAGSLCCYAMRITDIDPLRFGLLFERFLNPARVSLPDIDVDFCQDRREEAIAHVRDKYGSDLVAQIITFGRLKAKQAVRDICRVLNLGYNDADRISKLIPDDVGITLDKALELEPRLATLYAGDPKVRRLLDLARAIEGAVRHTGIHAAGVVIADRPLIEYAPLYRDEPEGGPVVQFDMKSAESIGLIKFDFLGLKTLDQVRDALVLIEKSHGAPVDLESISWDDEATYEMLERGDSLGVFQLESRGMRELLGKLRPSTMDDMVALVALFRPGPLQSGMTADFVDRKHGRKEVVYPLDCLEPILRETYGTIVYQEQVMQTAQVMANYSLGEADLLRRAMGKKKPEEMKKQKKRFVGGSVEQGIPKERAVEIFEMLAKFAAYGFNKSHSAAYGFIAYQTAWLKAHYRPEFMAAIMTIEAPNTDKLEGYIRDCHRAGMIVEAVCLNRSEKGFSVIPLAERGVDEEGRRVDVVRFGLKAVKGLGDHVVDALLSARESCGGSFDGVDEFFEAIDYGRVNQNILERLIKAGALDFTGHARAALCEGLEAAMACGARGARDRASGQTTLFGAASGAARPMAGLVFPDTHWTVSEQLNNEREVLGFNVRGHIMDGLQLDVKRYATCKFSDAEKLPMGGEKVRLLGVPQGARAIRTKRGDRMAFVQLGDGGEPIECVFFADAWARSQRAIESKAVVLVTGLLEEREGLKLIAKTVELLDDVRLRTTRKVRFVLNPKDLEGDRIRQFVDLLKEHAGRVPVEVELSTPESGRLFMSLEDYRVTPTIAFEERVGELFSSKGHMVLE